MLREYMQLRTRGLVSAKLIVATLHAIGLNRNTFPCGNFVMARATNALIMDAFRAI